MQGNVKQARPCQASPGFACVSIKLGYHREAWHSCSPLSSLLPTLYPSPKSHILAKSLKLVKRTASAWYDKHLESAMFHFEILLTLKTSICSLRKIFIHFAKSIIIMPKHWPIRVKLGLFRVETQVIKSTRMLLHSNNISGELKVTAGQSNVLFLLCPS